MNSGGGHDLVRGDHSRIVGLDGLRGLAVAMVLGFHLYPRLVPGGWLGVSLFFTLSGFLITTVILRDVDAGRFRFGEFYLRRVRRLVPAAMLVLALFTVSWMLLGWFDRNHRTDVFFSMLQIANWQQIWEGVPYGTALASPVVHYWSLAIEEQAYLLLPLLIVVSGARRLPAVASVLFVVSIAATVLANGDESLIYFGTHTRAAEILAGVIAATIVHRHRWRPQQLIAGATALAGITYLVVAAIVVHLGDDIVYSGGLIATGVISAMVIVMLPHSPLANLMDNRVMAWLGTVSYGVYLIHWPVLISLKRTDLPQWAVSPITLAATLVLAAAMHRRFEMPIRTRISTPRFLATTTAIVATIAAVFPFAVRPPASFEELQQRTTETVPDQVSTGSVPAFYFGDSKMVAYVSGLQNWKDPAATSPDRLVSTGGTFVRFGCPIGRGGSFMNGDKETRVGEGCDWTVEDVSTTRADVAVVWSGTWDAVPRRFDDMFDGRWVGLENPEYRNWLANEYGALASHLRTTHGIKIVAIVDYLGDSGAHLQAGYTDFLESISTNDGPIILRLGEFLRDQPPLSYLADGSHVSIGEPTEYSPNNDNSTVDLHTKWLEPALCAALSEEAPELLNGRTCPPIDYTPRVVRD